MSLRLGITMLALALSLAACGGDDAPAEEPILLDTDQGGEDPAPGDDVHGEADPDPQGAAPELVIGEDACETDADCVPAGCCHAAACVAASNGPDCTDTMCTADCQYGTLDCGGACLCHEGRCAARLSTPPDLPE